MTEHGNLCESGDLESPEKFTSETKTRVEKNSFPSEKIATLKSEDGKEITLDFVDAQRCGLINSVIRNDKISGDGVFKMSYSSKILETVKEYLIRERTGNGFVELW